VVEVALAPGDTLLVYSDGLSEASAPGRDEPFGEARLAEALARGARLSAAALREAILEAVERFAGVEHGDDRTLIVARAR
jgi:serine phosphatase RsbU (regulator of sigma subunit)